MSDPIAKSQSQLSSLVSGGAQVLYDATTEYQYAQAVSQYQNANIQFTKSLYDPNDPNYTTDPNQWLDRYNQFNQDTYTKINSQFLSLDAQKKFNSTFKDAYYKGASDIIQAAGQQQIKNFMTLREQATEQAGITGDFSVLDQTLPGLTHMIGDEAGRAQDAADRRKAMSNFISSTYATAIGSMDPTKASEATLAMSRQINATNTFMLKNGQIYVGVDEKGNLVGLTDLTDPSSVKYFTSQDVAGGGMQKFVLTQSDKDALLQRVSSRSDQIWGDRQKLESDNVHAFSTWLPNSKYSAILGDYGKAPASMFLSIAEDFQKETGKSVENLSGLYPYFEQTAHGPKDSFVLADKDYRELNIDIDSARQGNRTDITALWSRVRALSAKGDVSKDADTKVAYYKAAMDLSNKLGGISVNSSNSQAGDTSRQITDAVDMLRGMQNDRVAAVRQQNPGWGFTQVWGDPQVVDLQNRINKVNGLRNGIITDPLLNGGGFRYSNGQQDVNAQYDGMSKQLNDIIKAPLGQVNNQTNAPNGPVVLLDNASGPALYSSYRDTLLRNESLFMVGSASTSKAIGAVMNPTGNPYSASGSDKSEAVAANTVQAANAKAGYDLGLIIRGFTGKGGSTAQAQSLKLDPAIGGVYQTFTAPPGVAGISGWDPHASIYRIDKAGDKNGKGAGVIYVQPVMSNLDSGDHMFSYLTKNNTVALMRVPDNVRTAAARIDWIKANIPNSFDGTFKKQGQ